MMTQRIHLLVFALGVITLLVQSIVLQRRDAATTAETTHGPNRPVEEESPVSADSGRPSGSPSGIAGASADFLPMTTAQRWKVLTRSSVFQLIESGSLELKDVVPELLGLTPEQTGELKGAFSTFLDDVRAEELKQACVRVKGDGSEEVVVAPFDRGPLIAKFRDGVAAKVGRDAADFCAREVLFDNTLAVGNKEVRIFTQRGPTDREKEFPASPEHRQMLERMKDRERLMVSRGVHRKGFVKKPEWDGEGAPPMESVLSNTGDYGPRYRHLQEVKGRLPRKSE